MVEMITTSSSREVKSEQGGLFLPPGFRFHPTDEEVISSYLLKKLLNPSFTCLPIGEVDLNKCEPWDLPSKARMGEKEWYFFSHKDMKYPTGMRTNRATKEGYWKATGKDRDILTTTINNCPPPPAAAATAAGGGSREGREVVGMKKTLVFYMGRAPKGTKTNWVMHEFRLHGTHILDNHPTLRVNPKDEWVVCKVFHKKVDEATTNKKLHDAQQAAAAPETSAGTPNNGSSVVEAGDDLFHIDSIIDHPSVHLNNDSTSSSLPVPANQDMAAPYNDAYYSVLLTNDNAASTTTTSTTAASFQLPNYSLINTSAAPPLHVSSWNNMPPQLPVAGRVHGIGGYNLQQQQQGHDDHQQAAMVRALGGVIGGPNFGVTSSSSSSSSSSRGLSRSATAAGANSQQNSLWVPQHKIESYNDPFIWEY